jgi:hypothetical protein
VFQASLAYPMVQIQLELVYNVIDILSFLVKNQIEQLSTHFNIFNIKGNIKMYDLSFDQR